MAIRVAVVASYPSVRAGLRVMLEQTPEFEVEADLTPDRVAVGDFPAVDVLVVDQGDEGGEHAAGLESAFRGIPAVVLVSGPGEASEVPAGARAILLREATSEELAAAVVAVARGLVVAHPALASVAVGGRTPPVPAPAIPLEEPLTEREMEILGLVAQGLTNKAVALRLAISEHTVKFHLSAILGKLGAAARTEAVTIAVRRGLLAL
jgi:DNA-binding NarL/FixJ family response regulator